MINTNWLRTFCTLIEVGHFTRTAERLHMTQSGVSQHILKLEEQLGTELIIRQGKQFSLSTAGEKLYNEAQDILLALANLEQKVCEDPAFEGRVRVMSPGSVGLKLYPHLLTLQSQHPKLIIDYRFAPNHDVEKAVVESTVDIGLMTYKSVLPEVSCTSVARESLLLVTPANVEQPSWETLMSIGFIDHPDGNHHAELLLGANYDEFKHKSEFQIKGFSNQIGLILEPVSMGLGFTVLPEYAIEAFAQAKKIKAHSLPHPVHETLYIGALRKRTLPARMQTIIEEIKRVL